jgi:5-methyltetrahydrofolate--homocysteine methyltransferase
MAGLLYHPDWLAARERLTTWWNGGDIGRAVLFIQGPRETPFEEIPAMPEPEGWITGYSTKSMPYRVNCALRACVQKRYYAEAVPAVCPGDLAPNCLALYLGCKGIEMPGTVWCEPFIDDPDAARFVSDLDNFYWRFTQEATRQVLAQARDKFFVCFPDLIEGLDTLEGMRGAQRLLVDLIDRPEWVHACLRQITDRYFYHYDLLYNMIRDEVGGSVFWAWAPGRMAKFQCDFSAMISPAMFGEFMVPVLTEMTERTAYSMYHWDGPGALPHHDHLLGIPGLDILQWTPGAGAPPTWDPVWWPIYHKTLDAGKRLFIAAMETDHLRALKREFGAQSKGLMISVWAEATPDQAREWMELMEV